MKNLSLFLFLSIFLPVFTFAQFTSLNWYQTMTGSPNKMLVDKNNNTYVLASGVLKKFSPTGVELASSTQYEVVNMCMTRDSSALLVVGVLNTYNYAAGLLRKLDFDLNQIWEQALENTYTTISSFAYAITAVDESEAGIFTVQGSLNFRDKYIRRHASDGSVIWKKTIALNGTATYSENNYWLSFADDEGNQMYSLVSSNGNSTSMTINGVDYPMNGNSKVYRTYFALDPNGNTLWARTNINFQPLRMGQSDRIGSMYIAGSQPHPNDNVSNNPFGPDRCKENFNIIKGNIKKGSMVWKESIFYLRSGVIGNNGQLHILSSLQTSPINAIQRIQGMTANYTPPINMHAYFASIADTSGRVLRSFSIAQLSNFYTTNDNYFNLKPDGSYQMLYTRSNNLFTFSNGTAPSTNTSGEPQTLTMNFNEPVYPARHTTTWTGTAGPYSSWFNATNWTNGIPTDSSNVIFPAGVPYPNQSGFYYDFTNSVWAKCGYLQIEPGATIQLYPGMVVNGMIMNNGHLIYDYPASNPYPNSIGNQSKTIWGNGTIEITGIDGNHWDENNIHGNKVIINLNSPTATISLGCMSFDTLVLAQGIVKPNTYPANQSIYVHKNMISGVNAIGGVNSYYTGEIFLRNFGQQMNLLVGDANNLQQARLSFNNPTTINFLRAKFNSGLTGTSPNPSTCTINGNGIGSLLNSGFWSITPETPLETGNSYNLTTYLKGSTNATNASYYGLVKRSSSTDNWIGAGTYAGAVDSAGYAVVTATNIPSFSDYAVGVSSVVLPIYNLKLLGRRNGENNLLNWNIDGENIALASLQKSTDGRNFSNIYSENYRSSGNYSDVDYQGDFYYRLQVRDNDGKIALSNIVHLKSISKNIFVWTNESSTELNIKNTGTTISKMSLMNASGQIIFNGIVNLGITKWNIDKLAAGVYVVQIISSNGEKVSERILIR